MTPWHSPLRDTLFVLDDLLGIPGRSEPPTFEMLDRETIEAVVGEIGRFSADVLAPLNQIADREGCTRHADGTVSTPSGFKEAYRRLVDAGWPTLAQPEAFGGQGMPHVLLAVIEEYMNSACAGFMMYPGILPGAVRTDLATASDYPKET